MTSGYLDLLDAILAPGAASLSAAFRATQLEFALSRQRPCGGFPGRRGEPDLYYTDFALRTIRLLDASSPAIPASAVFLAATRSSARSVVNSFSWLSAARTILLTGLVLDADTCHLQEAVRNQSLPSGGYARPRSGQVSAYQSFLAALCLELLAEDHPTPGETAEALLSLQREGGGFAEHPGDGLAQTNATAAALAVLTITGRLDPGTGTQAGRFLREMQAGDGGFRAHARAGGGDLLSSFTALLSLVGVGGLAGVDLPALGRFLRAVACPGGGFGACAIDGEPDVEYTYYGIACLSILRGLMLAESA